MLRSSADASPSEGSIVGVSVKVRLVLTSDERLSRMKGFIVGLALVIIIGQVPKLIGLHKHEGDFFEQAWGILRSLGEIDWRTTLVGTVSLVLVLAGTLFIDIRVQLERYILYVAALSAVLLIICWRTGEPPRWRWGGK